MKVILYSESDNYTYVQGLMVPARYAAWAELILIQMFVPGVSFLGHLGGILAGLLYLYLRKASPSGGNPFIKIIRGFASLLSWPLRFANSMFQPSSSRVFGRGTIGRREMGSASGVWRCQACTFDNSIWLSSCEMCGTDRYDNEMSSPGVDTDTISLEELRQRRVRRFGR
ncbi:Rhomboid protease [Handroanthus impetiginosus]|uniref:Rhomboid protease n=1 Tax=Handroanthus impetiginosus TaxID=429701 RepID=A0A2G9G8D0_9LAMI|nr:Rhomboid protease [Handroanthus impetiginosus]